MYIVHLQLCIVLTTKSLSLWKWKPLSPKYSTFQLISTRILLITWSSLFLKVIKSLTVFKCNLSLTISSSKQANPCHGHVLRNPSSRWGVSLSWLSKLRGLRSNWLTDWLLFLLIWLCVSQATADTSSGERRAVTRLQWCLLVGLVYH